MQALLMPMSLLTARLLPSCLLALSIIQHRSNYVKLVKHISGMVQGNSVSVK